AAPPGTRHGTSLPGTRGHPGRCRRVRPGLRPLPSVLAGYARSACLAPGVADGARVVDRGAVPDPASSPRAGGRRRRGTPLGGLACPATVPSLLTPPVVAGGSPATTDVSRARRASGAGA